MKLHKFILLKFLVVISFLTTSCIFASEKTGFSLEYSRNFYPAPWIESAKPGANISALSQNPFGLDANRFLPVWVNAADLTLPPLLFAEVHLLSTTTITTYIASSLLIPGDNTTACWVWYPTNVGDVNFTGTFFLARLNVNDNVTPYTPVTRIAFLQQ